MWFRGKRRKYLINPRLQLPLLSVWVASVILVTIVFALITYRFAKVYMSSALDIPMQELYLEVVRFSLVTLSSAVTIGCVVLYVLGIYFTHRFAGPLVPIHRLLDSLLQGNYDVDDIQSRKNDALKDLIEKLNRLKNHLRQGPN